MAAASKDSTLLAISYGGYQMDDKALRNNILAALDWEPSINAAGIGVAVDKGVVTLTGHVETYPERFTAERIVKQVKGVRAVAEEIEVRPRFTRTWADDEIAKRAVKILDWDVTVPNEAVQVKVQNGVVTLTGEVEWNYQKTAAEEAVRKIGGVLGVTNLITLKTYVEAGDIKDRIEQALKRNAQLEADAIRVKVDGGRVTLEGKVRAWYERDVAENAAWAAPGVKSVDDRLSITY
jgi:osmotically-inducible protein OsmY